MRRGWLLILLLTPFGVNAQLFQSDIQKGFHALEKEEYDKALSCFQSSINEDSTAIAANFGFASVYIARNYSKNDPELAYAYIRKVSGAFSILENKKKIASLAKLHIDRESISALRSKIDDELFSVAANLNSVEGYESFISKYPGNRNLQKAKDLLGLLQEQQPEVNPVTETKQNMQFISKPDTHAIRLKVILDFEKAKAENTIAELKTFIQKNPDAEEVAAAKTLISTLLFEEARKINTVESYNDFIVQNPDAEEVNEAILLRNQLAYIGLMKQEKVLDNAELLKRQVTLEQQRLKNRAMGGGLLGILLLAGFLLYGYHQKRRSNIKIISQKEIIEEKNKEILQSINYAKRIQEAMLPLLDDVKQWIPDSFVYFKPRDIVSGDFYWFAKRGPKLYISAADCTGHGVPGALVSMMGYNFLNELVNDMGFTEPGAILGELHRKLYSALNKETGISMKEIHDGMDIALVSYDETDRSIEFSGALRPLYLFDETGFHIIKGHTHPIGGTKMDETKPFPTHRLILKGETTLYMFSDGFADQFGGPEGKKYKMKRFQELLQSLQKKNMEEQRSGLENEFLNWMGQLDQVDDVCVVGVRV